MYVQLCTDIVRTAMYIHCTYGPVRPKKLSFQMLSVPNPYVRACTYNVRTLYIHLPTGLYDIPAGILGWSTVSLPWLLLLGGEFLCSDLSLV